MPLHQFFGGVGLFATPRARGDDGAFDAINPEKERAGFTRLPNRHKAEQHPHVGETMPHTNNTEYARRRYATDPEFRARRNEAGRRHYAKMMQDPVKAEQYRARMRECMRRRKLQQANTNNAHAIDTNGDSSDPDSCTT